MSENGQEAVVAGRDSMKRLHSWRRLTPAPTVLLHQRRQPNIFRALEPSVESRLHFSFLILLSSFRRHNVWKRRWFASSDHTTDPPRHVTHQLSAPPQHWASQGRR